MVNYEELAEELRTISEGVGYDVSILSNASALLWERMDRLNWCGFYLVRDGKLILGPFQGKIACTEIAFGDGVCGTAAVRGESVVVEDVHAFSGHIACDSASNSEIVVPVRKGGALYGVLDIDSPEFARFSDEDRVGLEGVVRALEEVLV
jgi:GAF domain-containing protein